MTEAQLQEDSPVQTKLAAIMNKEFGIEEKHVSSEGKLSDDYDLDSLDRVELMMACEEEFNIAVPDEEAEKLITIGDVVQYIAKERE